MSSKLNVKVSKMWIIPSVFLMSFSLIAYSKILGVPTNTEKGYQKVMKLLSNYAARPLISFPQDAKTCPKTGGFGWWLQLVAAVTCRMWTVSVDFADWLVLKPHHTPGCRTEPGWARMLLIRLCPLLVPAWKIPWARERQRLWTPRKGLRKQQVCVMGVKVLKEGQVLQTSVLWMPKRMPRKSGAGRFSSSKILHRGKPKKNELFWHAVPHCSDQSFGVKNAYTWKISQLLSC